MIEQPQILVIGDDPLLVEEFEAAAAALRSYRPVVRWVDDYRQAAEAARSWRPQLALVDMSEQLGPLRDLTREIHLRAPETAVVGVFRPDIFAHDSQENVLLIEAVRAGVQDFLRRPLSSNDLAGLLDRVLHPVRRLSTRAGRVISFLSNKGGVGKSTLAVNTACGLARRHPEQVLLVDASLQIGTCAMLLDLHPATTLTDVARQRERLDETLIRQLAVPHASGLHLLAAPANAVEGIAVTDETLSRVLTLARRSYDYVIVDTFPIIDRIAIAVLDLADVNYIVLENVVPTLLAVAKVLELLASLGISQTRQRVILNRYQRALGNPRENEVADRLGRAVDHVVPYDRRVITAANVGEPFVLRARSFNRAGRAVGRIVSEIERLSATVEAEVAPASEMDGQAGNKHAGNGHGGNGHGGNGHAAAEHGGNGHAAAEHGGNGHASSGHVGSGATAGVPS